MKTQQRRYHRRGKQLSPCTNNQIQQLKSIPDFAQKWRLTDWEHQESADWESKYDERKKFENGG